MAVHTNDDIYTDTLERKRKSVVRRILFYFSRFLEKVHIVAYINRHKIGNIHDAHVARISNLLNKEITVETFYFGKKEMEKATINSVLTHECTMYDACFNRNESLDFSFVTRPVMITCN